MTPADLAVWNGATEPFAANADALSDLHRLGIDAANVDALELARVLTPFPGSLLPADAAEAFKEGRRYVLRRYDLFGAEAGLAYAPGTSSATGLIVADAAGLRALRSFATDCGPLTVVQGVGRFLRHASRCAGTTGGTLGVLMADDWTDQLSARVATRTKRILTDGPRALWERLNAGIPARCACLSRVEGVAK